MRIFNRIGVLAVVASLAGMGATSAQAAFGVDGGMTVALHQPQDIGVFDAISEGNGPPLVADRQAGGHPDLTVQFKLNEGPFPGSADPQPDGKLRDVTTDLPAGFYGNPQSRPSCTWAELADNQGYCSDLNAQVGTIVVQIGVHPDEGLAYKGAIPVYNVKSSDNEAAALAFSLGNIPTKISVTPRTEGDYGLHATIVGATQTTPIYGAKLTLWGDPSDPIHDRLRVALVGGAPDYGFDPDTFDQVGHPSTSPRVPFLSAPARCDAPLTTNVGMTSWEDPANVLPFSVTSPVETGCDKLKFEPTVDVQPTNHAAGQPSGYGIDVTVPQTNAIDQLSTPQVKDVSVKFPEGTALSPSAADGLDACSDAQLGMKSKAPEGCPDASKIGTVAIETPLLAEQLKGNLYVATQRSHDPESGEMYRVFLTAYGKGVRIKLKGSVKADAQTGQLTATFVQNPQLPFSKLHVQMNGGSRAPLVNPTTCGQKTTSATVSSYAGQSVKSDSSFTINQSCPTGRFSPSFNAGMTGPWAGAFSPFTMTVSRTDADQDLSRINLTMPSGLLGALGSVPLCSPAQAGAGTCPESTRIGTTQVAAGTGAHPYTLPGKVYVSGPYKGAPFSLSIVVPAKAGPYDLGTVVVRAQLRVDAAHAQVAAVSDPLPTIVGGVPIHMRMVNVTLDRPSFMFNATSCERMSVGGAFASTSGTISTVPVPYQARRCDGLKLQPSLKIGLSGSKEFKKGGHPKLHADLSQTFGQTGLKQVKVVLPAMLALAADNAQALCKPEQAAARNCPEGSIVGHATAHTPALHLPLSGPVYFVENTRTSKEGRKIKTLPKLWLKLNGEGVALDLWASSEIDSSRHPQRLVTTFENVPDAPIAGFQLDIDGGKHGILAATDEVCALSRKDRKAEVTFSGQNDGVLGRRVTLKPTDCALDAVSKSVDSKRVRVRVSGLGAGKLTISGKGIRKHSRTIKHATAATIAGQLTAIGKRLARDGKALRPRVSFNPKAKGKKTVSVKTTVKRAKKSSTR